MIERKTAIITGAASGIGLEATRRFSQDLRYNPIYAADINPSIQTIFPQSEYPNITPLLVDVRDRDQLECMLQRTATESGRLDVVVNAAGVMYKGKPRLLWDKSKEPPKEWEEMDQVNLIAPIIVMVEAPKIMKENGGGAIINITSAKYLFPDIHHIEYQRGKMRLSRVTRGIAKDWMKRDNVRVVDVQPGNTKTNIDRGVWTEGTSKSELEAAEIITKWWREKFGNDPKDVAEVIYQVAEGRIKGTTVYVGWDTKIGRALYLLTFPLAGYRLDSFFFATSTLFYQVARGINILKGKHNETPFIE